MIRPGDRRADRDELDTLLADAARQFPAYELAYTIIGTLTTAEANGELIDHLVADNGATLIVLGSKAQFTEDLLLTVERHHRRGVRVRTMEQFYEQWMGKLPLSNLERSALLTDVNTIHAQGFARAKRAIDLCFATLGLIPLALVTPFVAVGNLFGNRGPLFYSQPRVGLNDQVFRIHKFRTMRTDADSITTWTSVGDPRITRFGAMLRRAYLDELPQMLAPYGTTT